MRTPADPVVGWFELLDWHRGTWMPYIVWHLAEGSMRFELRRPINTGPRWDRWRASRTRQLSNSQLGVALSAMRRDELVVRSEDRSRVRIAVSYWHFALMEDFLAPAAPSATRSLRAHVETMDRIWTRRRDEHHRSS